MKDFHFQYSPLDRDLAITSKSGKRIPPTQWASSDHQGLDLEADKTNNVIAVANGEVIRVIKPNETYGNVIIVKHPYTDSDGKEQIALTLYAHLDSVDANIQEGTIINSQTILGKAGATGQGVSGPHLHLEIIDGNASWIDKNGVSHPSVLKSITTNAAKGNLSTGINGVAGRQKQLLIPLVEELTAQPAKYRFDPSQVPTNHLRQKQG